MRRKSVTILIVAKTNKLLDTLQWGVRVALNDRPMRILKETKLQAASEVIRSGKVDIFIIGTKVADGNGEELIKLIRELHPKHSLTVHLDEDDESQYQLGLYNKYDNIKCIPGENFAVELESPLQKACNEIDTCKQRPVAFSGSSEVVYADVDQICFITTLGDGTLHVEMYNGLTRKFYSATLNPSIFTSISNSSHLLAPCRCSYVSYN